MSFCAQVLWKRQVTVCARETFGMATVPTAAAPPSAMPRRKRRLPTAFVAEGKAEASLLRFRMEYLRKAMFVPPKFRAFFLNSPLRVEAVEACAKPYAP